MVVLSIITDAWQMLRSTTGPSVPGGAGSHNETNDTAMNPIPTSVVSSLLLVSCVSGVLADTSSVFRKIELKGKRSMVRPEPDKHPIEDSIASSVVDPKSSDISCFWKDDQGVALGSIRNLKKFVESKKQNLVLAMNGGMYDTNRSPKGLFIQGGQVLVPLDTSLGEGNFYLKPNGVFYLRDDRTAIICKSEDFTFSEHVKFATQSGPMLLLDSAIHPAFRDGSPNVFIRNGVGILPDGKVLFAISKTEINFFDFASYFRSKGCRNALYLDGFVSQAYLPNANWIQMDGEFAVMIGVTEPTRSQAGFPRIDNKR